MPSTSAQPNQLGPSLNTNLLFTGPVLPGERTTAFSALLNQLVDEERLQGHQQASAVYTLAVLLWRLNNLDVFVRAEAARWRYGRAVEEAAGNEVYLEALPCQQSMQLLDFTLRHQPERLEIAGQHRGGLKNFIAASAKIVPPEHLQRAGEQFETDLALARLGSRATPEALLEQAEFAERLWAAIEQQVRRLRYLQSNDGDRSRPAPRIGLAHRHARAGARGRLRLS